jgi:DNA-binding response OmpR family regulator
MPKMDGAEALNLIREEPTLNGLPVIVITTDESERERFYGYGVSDYIMKPFEFEKIRNAIYKHLKQRNH